MIDFGKLKKKTLFSKLLRVYRDSPKEKLLRIVGLHLTMTRNLVIT